MWETVKRPLMAGLLFFNGWLPFGATGGAGCVPWAYDVTAGAPRLVWLDGCESLPASSEEDPGLSALGLATFDDALLVRPADSPVEEGEQESRGPIFPLPPDAEWYLSSPFGPRTDPFTGRPAFHHGVDLAAAIGTPVLAFDRGRVIWAGEGGAYGLAVGIRHEDGSVSWYGHLSAIEVAAGAPVEQGQVIGRVGATGRATGPHLHFEIRRQGRRIDPWPELQQILPSLPEEGGAKT